ncbi:MAG: 16S rRNA (cytosine(1402)-N(4))-methyltransferase RsmH [Myxococcales bacterium]|nr:MAG: 16S rRNA (cytosine(1402)-N(4))-methyltransferase RsmH [Myxococcales bacterium]
MTQSEQAHIPVMLDECLAALSVRDGAVYADLTLGLGGHSEAILEASAPSGKLIAFDRDPDALALAKDRLSPYSARTQFFNADFASVKQVFQEHGVCPVDGLLADLGVSSLQLDAAERGFSFQHEGPLDMRMNPELGLSASELLVQTSEKDLANLLYKYGEEHRSRRIARAICQAKRESPIETTTQLANIVLRAIGRPPGSRIHPATRTFQALRIVVNQELEQLSELLEVLPDCIAPGGIAVVISFHSLEDRMVKYAFRDKSRWQPLTKKPLTASLSETKDNPRSRSAKMRAAKRVSAAEVVQ